MFSVGLGANFTWEVAVLSICGMLCFRPSTLASASHPQASQANLSRNLSNHLNLTLERSSRLLFLVYPTFTSCALQITLYQGLLECPLLS